LSTAGVPAGAPAHVVRDAESEYVAQNMVTLSEDKAKEVLELVDVLEQDDDVRRVFHNLG
jgi:transcriptional/translational regulatory protein YebC/TACO1